MIMKNNQIQKAMPVKGKSLIVIFLVFTAISFICEYSRAQEVDVEYSISAPIPSPTPRHLKWDQKATGWINIRKPAFGRLLSGQYLSEKDKKWLRSLLSRQYFSEKEKKRLETLMKKREVDVEYSINTPTPTPAPTPQQLKWDLKWDQAATDWFNSQKPFLRRLLSEGDLSGFSENERIWLRSLVSREHFSENDKKTLKTLLWINIQKPGLRSLLSEGSFSELSENERKWMWSLLSKEYFSEKDKKRLETLADKNIKRLKIKLNNFSFWSYSSEKDKMSNGTIKEAFAVSNNSVSFDYPYEGDHRAILILRKHPRWGKHVILTIEEGLFTCGTYCRVLVRFDKARTRSYRFVKADGNQIFIRGYNRFVSRLKKAKKLYIEAYFYSAGARVLEFKVQNLKF